MQQPETKVVVSPQSSDSEITTTDTKFRYLAYLARVRTLFVASSRYLAYTSDVGEAFRPVVHPRVVTAAYAISWAYVLTDVSIEGYKKYKGGGSTNDISQTVVKRATFQSVASMALPAFTIHTTVHIFKHVFHKLGRFQKWGPTAAGLAVIPILPYLFDHPVEHAVDKVFDYIWPTTSSTPHKPKHE